ncbi:YihY/virulence factor BrkB family protein [Variovorax sp. UMC13]|uniref:YihY/virulence factor BrkB family protein n=1 Tax=Variovorax sp. UMC13 TaxID=1862326 RepID=UPI0015FF8E2F|nr:YihY/virulence factor BrkB family protein [Variovorax sp. UMC13]
MKPQHLFALCRKAVTAWIDDFAPSMGASIAYYTVFSLAPLLVIVIAIAGAVFGREAVQGEIVAQLQGLIGRDGAIAVQGLIKSADAPARGLVAGGISIVVLLVGATTVFAELQSALDRIWHVPEADKPSGVWAVLRARVLSFGLILGLVFLLMVSLLVSAGVAAFGGWAGGLMPGWELLLQGLNVLISLAITTVLFAMIFKFMPTAAIRWRDVWVGAVVTAVLFEVGKMLIGLYIGKSGVAESFAAAGSLVVLLAWVYYAAQIFLLGAEFTKVYADEHGSVAGAKAVASTRATAAAADAGTDAAPAAVAAGAVAPVAAQKASRAPTDDEATLERTAETQRQIALRLQKTTSELTRQVAVLALATLASGVVARWQKRQRRAARRARQS